MSDDSKENLKDQWRKEIAVRKDAHQWNTLSDAGFVGLVGTELPEFLSKNKDGKPAWRLPLFIASSASILVGVVMNWIKSEKADELRESTLMAEHSHNGEKHSIESGQWGTKISTQQDAPQEITK